MQDLLKCYMEPMLNANIDYLVLGFTHYPYLIPQLIKILPQHIKIIDSGEAVAKHTKAVLDANQLLSSSKTKAEHLFYTNANNVSVMADLLAGDFNVSYLDF